MSTPTTPPRHLLSTLLGQQPAAIIGALQAVLVLLVSFGSLKSIHIYGQTDVVLVVAVLSALSALYTAWKTNETVLSPLIQLFQAALSLAAIYGFHLSDQQTGFAVAAITTVVSLFHATATNPLPQGSFQLKTAAPVESTTVTPV